MLRARVALAVVAAAAMAAADDFEEINAMYKYDHETWEEADERKARERSEVEADMLEMHSWRVLRRPARGARRRARFGPGSATRTRTGSSTSARRSATTSRASPRRRWRGSGPRTTRPWTTSTGCTRGRRVRVFRFARAPPCFADVVLRDRGQRPEAAVQDVQAEAEPRGLPLRAAIKTRGGLTPWRTRIWRPRPCRRGARRRR